MVRAMIKTRPTGFTCNRLTCHPGGIDTINQDINSSLLLYQIKPTTENTVFKVFVRYGQRPTVTEYDTTKKIPHSSCQKTSGNSHSHCSKEAYDVVLFPDVVNKPGPYYIGILYDNDDKAPQSRRSKRSCSGRGRQKRSCVEVKDPQRPENITVKPVYDPKTDVNYSVNLLEERCLFWDSGEEHWISRGCRVSLLFLIHWLPFSNFKVCFLLKQTDKIILISKK